jgi:hypothetical protein
LTRQPTEERVLLVAGTALLAIYFFRLARGGLHVFFSPDDLMNLHVAWVQPLGSLLRANLLFWETSLFGRPFGAAWYRSIYYFAGFNPVPFHIVNLILIGFNIALAYCVASRITGSREIGAITAVLFSYRPQMSYLYFNTGFIYDVLCCFFYLAAFLVYLRGKSTVGVCLLYVCALNSKELAVTFPVALLLYELIYRRGLRRWRTIAIAGVITLAFVVGRTTGAASLTQFTAYQPHLNWSQYMMGNGRFFGLLTDTPDWQPREIVLLWSVLFLFAWAVRSRTLWFASLFALFGALPVEFVDPRGPAQHYVCWFGWSLYGATVLSMFAALLNSHVRLRGAVVFVTLLAITYPAFKERNAGDVRATSDGAPANLDYARQLHAIEPRLPAGSKLLFLNDPYPADWWNLLFLVRLSYRDASLEVARIKQGQSAHNPDYIFDYRDGRFVELRRPQGSGTSSTASPARSAESDDPGPACGAPERGGCGPRRATLPRRPVEGRLRSCDASRSRSPECLRDQAAAALAD